MVPHDLIFGNWAIKLCHYGGDHGVVQKIANDGGKLLYYSLQSIPRTCSEYSEVPSVFAAVCGCVCGGSTAGVQGILA